MSTLDPAVYRKAADVIRIGGLNKGSYSHTCLDGRVSHCTVGALQVVTGRDLINGSPEVGFLAEMLALDPLPCVCGHPDCFVPGPVTDWNDELGRTETDVVGLLIEAAEKLEAEQGMTV